MTPGPTSQARAFSCLVVNADDFGLHPAVNAGICEAHRGGIVTSTSLMSCGEAFDDAVRALQAHPDLDVGVHLTIVGERPILSPQAIPSLVRGATFVPSHREFLVRWCLGRIDLRDVRAEWTAQIERARSAGLRLSHLDSHQHVHTLPGLWALSLELARTYDVPFVRRPQFESLTAAIRNPLDPVLRLGVNALAAARPHLSHPRFADAVRGLPYSGALTEPRLREVLRSLRPGLTELVVHPGQADADLRRRYSHWTEFSWDVELATLRSPALRQWCAVSVSLTSFRREAAEARRWSRQPTSSSLN